MKNKFKDIIIDFVFTLIIILVVFFTMSLFGYQIVNTEDMVKKMTIVVKEKCEYAYFEGQRDVLNGDVRIEWQDSVWKWTKSPWNNDSSINVIDLSKFKKQ